MPLCRDIHEKHHKLSKAIATQIKTVSILKDKSLKIVYALLGQLSGSQTLVSSKNYVSISPLFISCLSQLSFSKYVDQIFRKTRTSPLFQIIIYVLVTHKKVNLAIFRGIHKKHMKLSKIIETQIKNVSILRDNSMINFYLPLFQLSCLQTLGSSKNFVSLFPSSCSAFSEIGFSK